MATRHDRTDDQEFYEAMPGTMDRSAPASRERERDYVERTDVRDDNRTNWLPWLLIPLALLLGWALLNNMNKSNNNNNGNQSQPQTQQQQQPQQDTTQGGTP